MKRLMTVALLVGVSMSTYAQGVRVQGLGTVSCGQYIELRAERSPSQDGAIVSWVWGYMAGFNMESKYPTTDSLPDQASTLAYIDKHCRENPLANVIAATGALIKALGGRRNPR
jgi:hypothetical protein